MSKLNNNTNNNNNHNYLSVASSSDSESNNHNNGNHDNIDSRLLDARTAYKKGDIKASIAFHNAKRAANGNNNYNSIDNDNSPNNNNNNNNNNTNIGPKDHSMENHNDGAAEYLKSIVYGGLDGIITTFATVTSVAGAELSASVILVLGISHLFADGLSMGLGDSMSSQAELDYNLAERKREKWEMENNLEGEIQEMIELYMAKGISKEDSENIINTLAKYEEPFLDHMMVEELGLMKPDDDENGFTPLKAGIVTMLSFMLFGSVPLLPYIIALIPGCGFSAIIQLWSSVVFTVLTLFSLGALKGKLVELGKEWYWQGFIMAINGSFAAAVGYVIGWVMGIVVGQDAALASAAGR